MCHAVVQYCDCHVTGHVTATTGRGVSLHLDDNVKDR